MHDISFGLKTNHNISMQIYDLLMMNYVEDDDAMFRCDPSHNMDTEVTPISTSLLHMHGC